MASTVKEIAKKANVSVATVSRALNNDDKVKNDTKELVLSIAKQLNYTPNIFARNFVKKKSNIIGLILPDISDEFFSEIIRGVDQVSYSNGYYTTVSSSHDNRSIEETISTVLNGGLVGGIILLIPSLSPKICELLANRRIPIVLITGGNGFQKHSSVSIDNFQGAYDMVNFLHKKKNYNKFAFISGPLENEDAQLRNEGFRKACKDNNVRINKSWIVEGDFTKQGGREACAKILNQNKKPQIIFASNDMMAFGCYEVIANKGLRIPDDIAMVGFDDILISKYLNPALSTVRVQIPQIGKSAANLLVKKMEDAKSNIQNLKIPTELIIRESC